MSPVVNVDFSQAVERRLVPVDWYRVKIETVEVTKSSSKGESMLKVMLRIAGGQYDGNPLFQNWMLEGKGAGITKGAIRAFLGDDVAENRVPFDTDDLVGAVADARVIQKVWAEENGGDGELQNQIAKYRPAEYLGDDDEVTGLFDS